jgi:hypothetical protein
MKRLQIMIDEEIDIALTRKAHIENRSKAAIVRELIGKEIKPFPPIHEDPLWKMVGANSWDPEPVDDVVYR